MRTYVQWRRAQWCTVLILSGQWRKQMRSSSRSALLCKRKARTCESKSSQAWRSISATKYPYVPRSSDLSSLFACCLVLGFDRVSSIFVRRLVAVVSVFPLVRVLSFGLLSYLPTGTGTGGRANATNLGFFPRLGPRADRISRLTVRALSPRHARDFLRRARHL